MSERTSWFFRMKAAQRDLIARCGSIERAARIAEVSVPQMGRMNTDNADDLMSARMKNRLEADVGEPIVSRVEVEALGWAVHQVEPVGAVADCLHARTSRVVSEASEVIRAYADSMRDGKLSPADVAQLMKELAELAPAVEQARLCGAGLQALAGAQRHD